MKKSNIALASFAAIAAVGVFGVSTVFAAESLGTVTGRDGDILDKVRMQAEIVSVDGSHVTIKDSTTGDTYQTAFGPSWYSKQYAQGETVTVEGVVTKGENENGHNLQTMKVNSTELRSAFEGKPSWAGTNGTGDGQGQRHGGNGQQFVDANGDGKCDNLN